ncbi:hypothetical protein GJA_3162 [Janthinobacterium agaricidamnosum NBRC 102515 = DSM 9628]|uniref:Uncharacterized protein n=1 Tax=Janthinobacterium agaricidamnosum NBRC 102515 = DSM 9628 TaxID=1349767 RepID=W0V4M9_9BURK|nr:hypothetical protein GJA_3162 [Janthinobacterium agaricidamnosum NBRC 102515 = DSM 9628]
MERPVRVESVCPSRYCGVVLILLCHADFVNLTCFMEYYGISYDVF